MKDSFDWPAAFRNLADELERNRREHLCTMIALVKAAGGRVEIHRSDIKDKPRYELNRTYDARTDAVIYDVRCLPTNTLPT